MRSRLKNCMTRFYIGSDKMPFRPVAILSNGTYSKTLNSYI